MVGVLPGEGIGPQITSLALEGARLALEPEAVSLEVDYGGAIGLAARRISGADLSSEVISFCEEIFNRGGAILAGAGGGRFVYDMRAKFDLYLKLNPIQPSPELAPACRLRPRSTDDAEAGRDLLVVRENLEGLYHPTPSQDDTDDRVSHNFVTNRSVVRRLVDAACKLAERRRKHVTVVAKDSGVPRVTRIWREEVEAAAAEHSVACSVLDIDLAGYMLVQEPERFDVIAAPNCFGDILADLGGVIFGSRGFTYGASFSEGGRQAVYQTNHGCAHDLAGQNCANPCGQMLSMAMLLRESFGAVDAAERMVHAMRRVWAAGYSTVDAPLRPDRVLGTSEMGEKILKAIREECSHSTRSSFNGTTASEPIGTGPR